MTKYHSNVKKIFLITCLNSLIFAYVIERLFALERGLTVLEIQYIIILYSVISLILEIPSGVLADKWKKKYVLALGLFFCLFEFLICIFAYHFAVFSLAFGLAAVGGSLKSGTIDSILYESLREGSREQEYEKLQGNLKLLKYTTSGIAGIIGGYVGYHYELVTSYWLSLIGIPISILICLTFQETSKEYDQLEEEEIKQERAGFVRHILQSFMFLGFHRTLLYVILYGSLMGAILYGELHEMSSILYPELGVSIQYFGYVSLVLTLFGGLGGLWAYKLKDFLGYTRTFGVILFVAILSIYLFARATQWWELVYLLVAICFMEMVQPLTSGFLHHHVEDQYRVTISSIEEFFKNGLTILVGLLFGYVADYWSIHTAFQALAGVLCIYGCAAGLYQLFNWMIFTKQSKKYIQQ